MNVTGWLKKRHRVLKWFPVCRRSLGSVSSPMVPVGQYPLERQYISLLYLFSTIPEVPGSSTTAPRSTSKELTSFLRKASLFRRVFYTVCMFCNLTLLCRHLVDSVTTTAVARWSALRNHEVSVYLCELHVHTCSHVRWLGFAMFLSG